MLRKLGSVVLIGALSACVPAEPLQEYRPVVDPARTNARKFEADLAACRNIALKLEADYKKRAEEEMAANLMVGLLAGAVLGAAAGGDMNYAAAGAAYGAAAGAAAPGDYSRDLVKFGPRRVVDRCMAERGHAILNDVGRG